jgi:hypothetical protein
MQKTQFNMADIKHKMATNKVSQEQKKHISLADAFKLTEDTLEHKLKNLNPNETEFKISICLGNKPLSETDFDTLAKEYHEAGFKVANESKIETVPYTGQHSRGGQFIPEEKETIFYLILSE